MGTENLPKIFVDSAAETPDAAKWNVNFAYLNMSQDQRIINGDFLKFTGTLPDRWTLSGTGAASVSDADAKHGATAVLMTFGSTAAVLKQSATVSNFFKGRKTKAWCWVKTSLASHARIRINDGVGSTDSSFHTGGGAYELLIVEHDMAAGATEFSLELRVEAAGSARFDAAVMVDFDTLLSFIQHAEDVSTKEVFIPSAGGSNVGSYLTEQIASAGAIRHSWRVPHNYTSIVSAVLVAIPAATSGPQTIQLTTNHAAAGEDATSVQEQDLAFVANYTANEMQEFDMSSVLTGIAADDFVGLLFDRQGAGFGNLEVLGIRFRYI